MLSAERRRFLAGLGRRLTVQALSRRGTERRCAEGRPQGRFLPQPSGSVGARGCDSLRPPSLSAWDDCTRVRQWLMLPVGMLE